MNVMPLLYLGGLVVRPLGRGESTVRCRVVHRRRTVKLSPWLLVITNLVESDCNQNLQLIYFIFATNLNNPSFNGWGVSQQLIVKKHCIDDAVHLNVANSSRH